MAAKKKSTTTTKAKRPPRQVWILFEIGSSKTVGVFSTKRDALRWSDEFESVAGPYVLAERRGQE